MSRTVKDTSKRLEVYSVNFFDGKTARVSWTGSGPRWGERNTHYSASDMLAVAVREHIKLKLEANRADASDRTDPRPIEALRLFTDPLARYVLSLTEEGGIRDYDNPETVRLVFAGARESMGQRLYRLALDQLDPDPPIRRVRARKSN